MSALQARYDLIPLVFFRSADRTKAQVHDHIAQIRLARRELKRGVSERRARQLLSDIDYYNDMWRKRLAEWREQRGYQTFRENWGMK